MKSSYLSLLAFVASALAQTQVLHPNRDSKMCLDARDRRFVNGTAVQLWPCNDTPAQELNFDFGPTAIRFGKTGFCLDATANPVDGTPMRVWECGSLPEQQWLSTVTAIGGVIQLVGTTSTKVASDLLCLDLNRSDHASGTLVQVGTCVKGMTNQIWSN
ncbi:carbohydrate-binding module family 13 protein [Macrolepiota fuliginosa MF-IS2]|uniref:Carbohydrate-binding module family 13 protein n=1 Tax=Macrolepiota fuliginosa MF-IS2 TaxID=1400762 RepID=A0A9P5X0Z2_9AGAR|nr:carbohydrate-binding module family 13 protein [Macrolepiota fuliginosa MF-IS2]